jgi:hypothetical protein
MITAVIKEEKEKNWYSFTLVRGDVSYLSGSRQSLKEIYDLIDKELTKEKS